MRINEFELRDPVPELRRPIAIAMLRPWIDVGRVGTLALNNSSVIWVRRSWEDWPSQEIFRLHQVPAQDAHRQWAACLHNSNTIIHHANDEATDRDYLFLHIREPHAFGEDYCRAISDVLSHFDIQRVLPNRRNVRFRSSHQAAAGNGHNEPTTRRRRRAGAGVAETQHVSGAYFHRQHGVPTS